MQLFYKHLMHQLKFYAIIFKAEEPAVFQPVLCMSIILHSPNRIAHMLDC